MIFSKLFRASNLWSAAAKGDVQTIVRLVAEGQDINAKKETESVEGETPLHFAAKAGQADAIKALIKLGAQINAKDNDGRNSLMAASANPERRDVVEVLLDLGANMDAQDKAGMTALDYAAVSGSVDIVRLLLERKAGLNVGKGSKRSSPIFHAVEGGSLEILRLLITANADVNSPHAGTSPLAKAAFNRQSDFVRLLLDAGANVEQRDEPLSGRTPLLCAVAGGSLEVVELLIKAGARVNVTNESTGESALDIAETPPRNARLVEYLHSVGAKRGNELSERESKSEEETGTFWQLQDDSVLSVVTNPYPPREGDTQLEVEVSENDHGQRFTGTIEYRVAASEENTEPWVRLSAGKVNEDGNVLFSDRMSLRRGTNVIQFRIRGKAEKDFTYPEGWRIEVR